MNEFQAWQEIIEEWKQVDKMKEMNQRLYDELGGAIIYILEYSERNNIVLPNRDRLYGLIENIHKTTDAIKSYHDKINKIPPKSKHPPTTPEDSTQPS